MSLPSCVLEAVLRALLSSAPTVLPDPGLQRAAEAPEDPVRQGRAPQAPDLSVSWAVQEPRAGGSVRWGSCPRLGIGKERGQRGQAVPQSPGSQRQTRAPGLPSRAVGLPPTQWRARLEDSGARRPDGVPW